MSRDIRKVRKAIEQRKKERKLPESTWNQANSIFDNPEEKHGYPPDISNYAFKERVNKEYIRSLMMKGIIAGILFFAVALLMNANHSLLEKPQQTAYQLLQNDFPFAKVNVWYQEVFGTPLAFSPQINNHENEIQEAVMPVQGDIVETFQTNGTGVKISPGTEVEVFAHQEGVIIYAGNNPATDKTIIIQHADGTNSSYGYLSDIDVHLYQYVSGKQRIGTFTPTETVDALFFSLEKDNTFLDPIEVMEVDDVP